MRKSRLMESAKDAAFEAGLSQGMDVRAALIFADEGETYLPQTGDMVPRGFMEGSCGVCSGDATMARTVVHLGVACWMRLCAPCADLRVVAWDGSSEPAYAVAEAHLASLVSTGTVDKGTAFTISRRGALRRGIRF